MNRLLTLPLLMLATIAVAQESKIEITDDGTKARVTIDDELFTEYCYSGYAKPILYPVFGPAQTPMTRNYPMVEGVQNEATDHPHHKSIWYTHDEVNEVRFWMESGGKKDERVGTQVQTSIKINGATITCTNDWKDGRGETICGDKRVITFGATGGARWIDYEVSWIASHGDIHIGDTKEGTMGIRTHPQLRLKANPKRGNTEVSGHSINSEGVRDRDMWGKRAAWVDYWGTIDDKVVGVAIFDHPTNPRHPTWWHARDYGLIAANPFGVNHFEGKPDGTGDMIVKSGQELNFRYRFVFHEGDVDAAKIAEHYEGYGKQ